MVLGRVLGGGERGSEEAATAAAVAWTAPWGCVWAAPSEEEEEGWSETILRSGYEEVEMEELGF